MNGWMVDWNYCAEYVILYTVKLQVLTRVKGKFFSEDIMLLVGSPYFANILLSLCTEKMFRSSKMFAKHGDPTSFILSSEKNLPLHA